MLSNIKNKFNNLSSSSVMDQNVTSLPELNQILNQETSLRHQARASLEKANNNLNSIKTVQNKLKIQENNANKLLSEHQNQVSAIDSYLTDFANNEFEDTTTGNSTDLNIL